jgi:hypothetical protein
MGNCTIAFWGILTLLSWLKAGAPRNEMSADGDPLNSGDGVAPETLALNVAGSMLATGEGAAPVDIVCTAMVDPTTLMVKSLVEAATPMPGVRSAANGKLSGPGTEVRKAKSSVDRLATSWRFPQPPWLVPGPPDPGPLVVKLASSPWLVPRRLVADKRKW